MVNPSTSTQGQKAVSASITTLHHQHKTNRQTLVLPNTLGVAMNQVQLNGTDRGIERLDALALTYTLNDFGINNITTSSNQEDDVVEQVLKNDNLKPSSSMY
ncbi:hypothetical protein O9992_22015 [Vibrio lentus]|nr:hypothetical protein [Vibrio lentus]